MRTRAAISRVRSASTRAPTRRLARHLALARDLSCWSNSLQTRRLEMLAPVNSTVSAHLRAAGGWRAIWTDGRGLDPIARARCRSQAAAQRPSPGRRPRPQPARGAGSSHTCSWPVRQPWFQRQQQPAQPAGRGRADARCRTAGTEASIAAASPDEPQQPPPAAAATAAAAVLVRPVQPVELQQVARLRADAYYEDDRTRFVESFKRQFAAQV